MLSIGTHKRLAIALSDGRPEPGGQIAMENLTSVAVDQL